MSVCLRRLTKLICYICIVFSMQMIWAADFDLSLNCLLDDDCPEILSIHLPKETEAESGEESADSNNGGRKGGIQERHGTVEYSMSDNSEIRCESPTPFCGLGKPFWSRSGHFQIRTLISSTKNGDDELPVFCVAAILIMNRHKIIRETRSIDDLIKACDLSSVLFVINYNALSSSSYLSSHPI